MNNPNQSFPELPEDVVAAINFLPERTLSRIMEDALEASGIRMIEVEAGVPEELVAATIMKHVHVEYCRLIRLEVAKLDLGGTSDGSE